MRKLLLLSLTICTGFMAAAQSNLLPACGSPLHQPARACNEVACVLCDLDGYFGRNNMDTALAAVTVCNTIVVHNPIWLAFVAGTQHIALEIHTGNCVSGNGLQAVFFKECYEGPLACNGGAVGSAGVPILLEYPYFKPGETYLLLLDGYEGDICDFSIDVVSGTTVAPDPGPTAAVEGPSNVCPGAQRFFRTQEAPGAGYYHWQVLPQGFINNQGNDLKTVLPEAAIELFQGASQICVAAGGACVNETPAECKIVTASALPNTVLPADTIPFDQLPFIWTWDNSFSLSTPGTYNLTATLVSYLGCDSMVIQKIIILPPSPGYITGYVYWDVNANGILDMGEPPYLSGAVIKSSNGDMVTTNGQGKFSFTNLSPGDTVTALQPQPGLLVSPAFRLYQTGSWNNYNFGLLTEDQTGIDLNIQLNATILRPGFSTWLTVICKNRGFATAEDVRLELLFPAGLQYSISSLAPSGINGNLYGWDLGDLVAGQALQFQIELRTPLGTPLGDIFSFSASITPLTDDIFPLNNFSSLRATVRGSYDPNDKQVEPKYVTPAMLAGSQAFEYTIRFQNTGNFPADFVRIVDTLGSDLDPSSFQLMASSHPCQWKISAPGIMECYFKDIFLPDSSSDEARSHGFVRFAVRPRAYLPVGASVYNNCDIYFDFNPPIRTNTAGTRVVHFLPGSGLPSQDALSLRPNPTAYFVFCNWNTPAPAAGSIRLYNSLGIPVRQEPVAEGQSDLHVDVRQLPPGVYYVLLEAGSLLLTNRLVVTQAPLSVGMF